MITSQLVAELVAAGLSGEALVAALKRIEEASPNVTTRHNEPSKGAVRQKRYREKKRLECIDSDVTQGGPIYGGEIEEEGEDGGVGEDCGDSGDAAFPTSSDIAAAIDAWQILAELRGLPKLRNPNKPDRDRVQKLKARLRELGSLDAWGDVLLKVRDSPFCCGDNNRNWLCHIDYLLRPTGIRKILEGNFDQVSKKQTAIRNGANGHAGSY